MLKLTVKIFLIFLILSFSCTKREQEKSIIFTGDILLDRGVRKLLESNDTIILVKNLKNLFKGAVHVIGNLECPTTTLNTPVYKKFVFNSKPEYLKLLKQGGFTYLSLANNHSYDYGRNGLINTAENIKQNGMIPIGYGNTSSKAEEPVILKEGNLEFAIFSSVRLALENWMFLPDKPTISQISIEKLCRKIRLFKRKYSETKIIVYLHWGIEYMTEPTEKQRIEARMLIDSGTDIIIGHHPHVAQIIETYKNKKIFYSLGNFIFDQNKPGTNEGYMVKIRIGNDKLIGIDTINYKIRRCIPY